MLAEPKKDVVGWIFKELELDFSGLGKKCPGIGMGPEDLLEGAPYLSSLIDKVSKCIIHW